MFTQTWKIYLPAILILIKRSAQGEQVLSMNHSDFERAAGGRKMKFSFVNLQLNKGKINSDEKHLPIARELASLLQLDPIASRLISTMHIDFNFGRDMKLIIRNTTPIEQPITDDATLESDATNTGEEL